MKKIAQREKNQYLRHARNQAQRKLQQLGHPATIVNNSELASRLALAGLIPLGNYGKKSSATALIAWYRGLDSKDKIKRPQKKVNKKVVTSDDFLQSWEWTNLRYRVLQFHGRQCQCCGAKPPAVILHVDHIKPRSKYPELALEFDNLQVLCASCNKGKSNKHEDDFRDEDWKKKHRMEELLFKEMMLGLNDDEKQELLKLLTLEF